MDGTVNGHGQGLDMKTMPNPNLLLVLITCSGLLTASANSTNRSNRDLEGGIWSRFRTEILVGLITQLGNAP